MTELTPELTPEQHEHMRQAFLEGFASGVAHLPPSNIIETSEGPVEGRMTPEGMAFDTSRGELLVTYSDDGTMTITRYGRVVGRVHPPTMQPDEDPEP